MNLGRNDVIPAHQSGCWNGGGNILVLGGRDGERVVTDRTCRQIVSIDLGSIDVNGHPIIAENSQGKGGDPGSIGYFEAPPKVSGDIFAGRVGAIADDGAFVPIAVTQLGWPGAPRAIVIGRLSPETPLVCAV